MVFKFAVVLASWVSSYFWEFQNVFTVMSYSQGLPNVSSHTILSYLRVTNYKAACGDMNEYTSFDIMWMRLS